MFAVAACSSLRHLDKLERFQLPDRWRYRVAVNAELDELVERDHEATVLSATVIGMFDFEPVENTAS